jgi:hypothetical protein
MDIHSRSWLDYNFLALAVLITGISILELVIFGF